jgi:hypothetical protein
VALAAGGAVGLCAMVIVGVGVGRTTPTSDPRPAAATTTAEGSTAGFTAECSDQGLNLRSASASASPDGVHVDASGPPGSVLYVRWEEASAPTDAFIVPLEEKAVELVMPIPPGPFSIGCFDLPFDAGAVDLRGMTTATVSSSPHWADPGVRCLERSVVSVMPSSTSDLLEGATLTSDEVVSHFVPALKSEDRLRPAFYVGAEDGAVAVIREGETIAVAWPRMVGGFEGPVGVDMIVCDGVDLG